MGTSPFLFCARSVLGDFTNWQCLSCMQVSPPQELGLIVMLSNPQV